MVRIRDSILIDRPVEVVFERVADQRNEPRFNPAMTECRKVTDGPIGVGTRFASTMASRGRPLAMVSQYTVFDRPHLLGSETTSPMGRVAGTLRFHPEGTGTRMEWDWQLSLSGAARLLAPVMPLLGRRMERSIWTGLKTYLETDAITKPDSDAG